VGRVESHNPKARCGCVDMQSYGCPGGRISNFVGEAAPRIGRFGLNAISQQVIDAPLVDFGWNLAWPGVVIVLYIESGPFDLSNVAESNKFLIR
jgi:hypothetical protein